MVLIQGVLGSKNLFCKNCSERSITLGYTPFQIVLDMECVVALQAVSECPGTVRLVYLITKSESISVVILCNMCVVCTVSAVTAQWKAIPRNFI